MGRTPRKTSPQTRGTRSRSVGDPYGDTKRPSSMFAVRTFAMGAGYLPEVGSSRVCAGFNTWFLSFCQVVSLVKGEP